MSDEELAADLAACLLDKATEEGQKVARNSGLVSLCRFDKLPIHGPLTYCLAVLCRALGGNQRCESVVCIRRPCAQSTEGLRRQQACDDRRNSGACCTPVCTLAK